MGTALAIPAQKLYATATDVVFGRDTASAGAGEEISMSALRTMAGLVVGTNVQAYNAATLFGALGATDNALLRADGTGGVTAQGSSVYISDAGLLQLGGTTSSFPALKRSSAIVQARLADDSAYAAMAALSLTVYEAAGVKNVAISHDGTNSSVVISSGNHNIDVPNAAVVFVRRSDSTSRSIGFYPDASGAGSLINGWSSLFVEANLGSSALTLRGTSVILNDASNNRYTDFVAPSAGRLRVRDRATSTNYLELGHNGTNATLVSSSGSVLSSQPVGVGSYAVASLPAAGTAGRIAYASNGRKSGEGAAAGTGCPVWDDGTNWKTFYDNTTVAA